MDCFSKLLDEIYKKLEAIYIYLLELHPQHFLVSIDKFIIYKLHFFPAKTTNIGEVVDVVVVSSGRVQLKRDFSKQ